MQRGKKQSRQNSSFQFDESKIYLAFYKPYGVVSQFTPPQKDNPDAHQTLLEFGFPKGVYPVGRLDHDSEGLLILTDDPRLNQELLKPERQHSKTYLAQVERIPQPQDLMRLEQGLLIEGRRTLPSHSRLLDEEPALPARSVPIRHRKTVPTAWIELTIIEGRNRQVRKMTAAIGFPTLRLVRTAIGSLDISRLNLTPGAWLRLSPQQLGQALSDYQPAISL